MLRDFDPELLLVPDSVLEERSRLLRMKMSLIAGELRNIDTVKRFKNIYRSKNLPEPEYADVLQPA